MFGIVGIYSSSLRVDITPLLQWLKHRGPDGSRVIQTAIGALGYTHLALLNNPIEQQFVHHEAYYLAFDGALYNLPELHLRYRLDQSLPISSDAARLLHLYRHIGPECTSLLHGTFAVAILTEQELFLARDPLGVKPLYYGEKGNQLFFASEIKALAPVVNQVREFPPGHWYHSRLGWQRYYHLPTSSTSDEGSLHREAGCLPLIQETLRAAVYKRLMGDVPFGVNLSGGSDSSIVALLASEHVEPLYSFAVGVEGSSDLATARTVANFLGTKHYDYVYRERDIAAVLPDIIYHLESFDPALVRDAIPAYFLAQLAAEQVKVLLIGGGAAELYAGYGYLRSVTKPTTLQAELVAMTGALHNTKLQLVDRMTTAHSLEACLPFLDLQAVTFALNLPAAWKLHLSDRPASTLLQRAFVHHLPPVAVKHSSVSSSQETGWVAQVVARAENSISDSEFAAESLRLKMDWHYQLPTKEALYYYKILRQFYSDEAILPSMSSGSSLYRNITESLQPQGAISDHESDDCAVRSI